MPPHFEREARHGGRVAGVDEVGRGPLAGPVVAAAVVFVRPPRDGLLALVDDSKALNAVARERAYAALRAEEGVVWALGAASVGEILRLNILHASLLAMRRAVMRLAVAPDLVLVDGNKAPALPCDAECCIGGDAIHASIAAASILAKVVRDRVMAQLDRRYAGFGWADNAGYGTPAHRAGLMKWGPTPHHRAGFGTVRAILEGTLSGCD